MNRQELINENLDEHAVIRECDAGTDASERLAAAIAEREAMEKAMENMRLRLATVLAERDELKTGMRLWMAAAIANAVVLFITTFAF